MRKIIISNSSDLTLNLLRASYEQDLNYNLARSAVAKINAAKQVIDHAMKAGETIYGVNTGFGKLANIKISEQDLVELQHKLLNTHAVGVGPLLDDAIVKLILLLKIQGLSRGYSGIRIDIILALLTLLNKGIFPCIPCKGSVGASGDIAPIAHLAVVLLGEGKVRINNSIQPGKKGLIKAGLKPIKLAPKEGLALINCTQVSTALALSAFFYVENIFAAAMIAGCLSVIAAGGKKTPFDARIQHIRRQQGQIDTARIYRELLSKCKSNNPVNRVQDPYSLRCQPQVMGACLDHLRFVADILHREANSVTDNPLIFSDDNAILTGGNFHAEPVAMAADGLALVIAEVAGMAERRIALLIDTHISGLPAFLSSEPGINSGFMIAQVTAAALVSENKTLAHPASIDSIPTSANQEDHVSMATFAARRLLEMAENAAAVIAIEPLAACQGIELSKTKNLSSKLAKAFTMIRKHSRFYRDDYLLSKDIDAIKSLVLQGEFNYFVKELLPSLRQQ